MKPAVEVIRVRDLTKSFRAFSRREGVGGAFRNLFRREYQEVRAVDGIDLSIREGEIVGYIGPNGAGKSTTINASDSRISLVLVCGQVSVVCSANHLWNPRAPQLAMPVEAQLLFRPDALRPYEARRVFRRAQDVSAGTRF